MLELYKQLGRPLEDKEGPNNVRGVDRLLSVRLKEGTLIDLKGKNSHFNFIFVIF